MSVIEERYAKALLDVAIDHNYMNEFNTQINLIANTFKENYELMAALVNPTVNATAKKKIVEQVFDEFDPKVISFLKILVEKERINEVVGIAKQYNIFVDKIKEKLNIQIISAFEIEQSQIQGICEKFKKIYGSKSVEPTVLLDKSLIGGIVVKVGDKVYDNSIKTRINSMIETI